MSKREVSNIDIIKKGEAATLLGFGQTAGYKYMTYLEVNKLIDPVFLPGIKTPRFRKADVQALIDSPPPSNVPQFVANP